ncbi:D-tyrosyl-tRNA deacylase [Peziza echinospora]|nr:D-tyrosyl-tRNA deacylase [Peziza echinospora]
MKAVIQRVLSASVTVDSKVVSSIGKGILVLAAVSPTDTTEDAQMMVRKLLSLKLWPDANNRPWANSVVDISGEVLIVSQFTLYANIGKGSKPDFHGSASPDIALPYYTKFVELVKEAYKAESVKDGIFGAMMNVQLINDGPVTFDFDTAKSGAKQVGGGGSKEKTGQGREGSSGLGSEKAETEVEVEVEATSTTDGSANAFAPSVPSKSAA